MMRTRNPCYALTISLVWTASAFAAPVNQVSFASIGDTVVDFSDIATAAYPSQVVYDGVLTSGGVQFAERFVGQTLSAAGDSDILSGTPTGPLTLQTGLANQNLSGGADVIFDPVVGLYPCGPRGCTSASGYGEGSFAMLFPAAQAAVGFEVIWAETTLNNLYVQFFRTDGSLIDSLTLATGAGNFATVHSFGFARDGGLSDIAGVSVYNTDPGGLVFDNVRFTMNGAVTNPVPEPGTFLLFGAGLAGLAFLARRRRLA